jgi:hypothetical protein
MIAQPARKAQITVQRAGLIALYFKTLVWNNVLQVWSVTREFVQTVFNNAKRAKLIQINAHLALKVHFYTKISV